MAESYRTLPVFGDVDQLRELVLASDIGDLMQVSRVYEGMDAYYRETVIRRESYLGRISVNELVEDETGLYVPASKAIRTTTDLGVNFEVVDRIVLDGQARSPSHYMRFSRDYAKFWKQPMNNELYGEDPEFYDTERPVYIVEFVSSAAEQVRKDQPVGGIEDEAGTIANVLPSRAYTELTIAEDGKPDQIVVDGITYHRTKGERRQRDNCLES